MKKYVLGVLCWLMLSGSAWASYAKIFVTVSETGKVATFDIDQVEMATPIVNFINVGGSPWGITTNIQKDQVYVTDPILNRVLRIDSATETVTATLTAPQLKKPLGIAVHPINGNIYVANSNGLLTSGANIAVIDPTTFTIRSTINIPGNPYNLAFTPDGTKLYVTDYRVENSPFPKGGNALRIINMADLSIKKLAFNGSSNFGIGVNRGTNPAVVDRMYFPIQQTSSLASHLKGSTVNPAIVTGFNGTLTGNASDIVITKDGVHAYISAYGTNYLYKVNLVTKAIETALYTSYSIDSHPFGMVLSPAETRLYVVNYSRASVGIIDTASGLIQEINLGGGAIGAVLAQPPYCSGW